MVHVFLQKGRQEVWICSRLSFFLGWKILKDMLQTNSLDLTARTFWKMLLREVVLRIWVFYMTCTCKHECGIFWSVTLCISVYRLSGMSTRFICWYMQKKFLHLFFSGDKKTIVITNNIKADRWTEISLGWENAVLVDPGVLQLPSWFFLIRVRPKEQVHFRPNDWCSCYMQSLILACLQKT